ncbi:M9 family metallopeptidase N-terminal domain-containing protein [Rhodanobacter sp. FW102-FHT14D06]|uniref:M9 family metallopeptidase N-terminal domain-containing protein n=2 Tax=unclassified Rhodanobacter TaxID=2621553 RepID=A0AB74USE5_9GAMM
MNTCARKSRPRCASLSLLTPGCSLPRYAAPTKARKKAPAPAATALRTTSLLPTVRHRQARLPKPSGRPPQSSSKAHLYADYGRPERNPSASLRMSVAAAATHDVNAFASAGGSSLVTLVRNSSVDACIDTLFSVTGASAGQVFNQAKMVTIANALQSGAPGHTKCGRASPAFLAYSLLDAGVSAYLRTPDRFNLSQVQSRWGWARRSRRSPGTGPGQFDLHAGSALEILCWSASVTVSWGGGVKHIRSRRQIRRSDRIPAKSIPVARSNTRRIRFSSVAVVCSLTELEQAPNVCSSKEISA